MTLQNLDKKFIPIINLAIGMACKIIIELMFVPSKGMGIYAYGIACVVCFVVSGVLNLYAVERSGVKLFDIKYLTKQFALGTVILGLFVVFKLFNSLWSIILGWIFTGMVYLVISYLIKVFTKHEIGYITKR